MSPERLGDDTHASSPECAHHYPEAQNLPYTQYPPFAAHSVGTTRIHLVQRMPRGAESMRRRQPLRPAGHLHVGDGGRTGGLLQLDVEAVIDHDGLGALRRRRRLLDDAGLSLSVAAAAAAIASLRVLGAFRGDFFSVPWADFIQERLECGQTGEDDGEVHLGDAASSQWRSSLEERQLTSICQSPECSLSR